MNDAPHDHMTVSVSQPERELLDARLRDLEEHPKDQSAWPEVQERLRELIS